GADIIVQTNYIDGKILLVLSTTIQSQPDIEIELDIDKYFDALIESVECNKILAKTTYIKNEKDKLFRELESTLFGTYGKIINSSEPTTALVEVYNGDNTLIAKANRYHFDINVNSLDITLCEVLGDDFSTYEFGDYFKLEIYFCGRKIIAESVEINEVQSHQKIRYVKASCNRADLSIEDSDGIKYNNALESIKMLNVGNAIELELATEYLINNNTPQKLLNYVRKNKIKSNIDGIDINKYLLEDLL
ncbi:MAG: hypothetical protein ACRDB0_00435, partial [Paraclostridium sp.]